MSAKPVLLILVGSDMSVMDALQSCGRPFSGRAAKMTVHPLHQADVQAMTGLDAVEAVDALLITGGFPEIIQSWRPGMGCRDFLREKWSRSRPAGASTTPWCGTCPPCPVPSRTRRWWRCPAVVLRTICLLRRIGVRRTLFAPGSGQGNREGGDAAGFTPAG
ncbi:hypothetical protein [Streptomyces sp. cmx-4-9]|uniref:hypothetical protein n=1 Tax=Streptomyces sp. cmx-4-9 TaxID=2790941 RepID=UPI0039804D57